MRSTIDVDKVRELIFDDNISIADISRLSGVEAKALYHYRDRSVDFTAMPIAMALKLQDISDKARSNRRLPPGISAVPGANGGVAYTAIGYIKGKHNRIGTYTTVDEAVSKRNEFIFTHRSQIKTKKRAREIEVTPELEAKVKATRGLSFYRDRKGRITGIRAEYMRDRKRKYLGKFPNLEEAKKAYDDQANGTEENGGNIDE